ncbi:MAG: FmdB family zinc ribbon protein [Calditrichota bacterium]
MPTYEYRCENGHTFEEFQSMLAAPVDVCPICGGTAERQISGGTGLIFKGSGFYITDYGKKNSSPPSNAPKSAKSEPAAAAPATSSTVTETKSSPKKDD